MSPSREQEEAPKAAFGAFADLNLAIIGMGVEYPPFHLPPGVIDTLCQRHYPDTPAYVFSLPPHRPIDLLTAGDQHGQAPQPSNCQA